VFDISNTHHGIVIKGGSTKKGSWEQGGGSKRGREQDLQGVLSESHEKKTMMTIEKDSTRMEQRLHHRQRLG